MFHQVRSMHVIMQTKFVVDCFSRTLQLCDKKELQLTNNFHVKLTANDYTVTERLFFLAQISNNPNNLAKLTRTALFTFFLSSIFVLNHFRENAVFLLGRARLMSQQQLLGDGTKIISLSKGQFVDISTVLQHLRKQIGRCPAAILVEMSGLLIAKCGHRSLNSNGYTLLATLAAANYAATNQMANLVGELKGFKTQFLEGKDVNIFMSSVSEDYLLVMLLVKDITFEMATAEAVMAGKELSRIIYAPTQ